MSSSKTWLAAALAATALAGCASAPDIRQGVADFPFDHYKTPVTLQAQPLLLAVNPQGPSPAQRAALYDMMTRWRAAPGGAIVVETPAAAGPEAVQAANRIEGFMREYGVGQPEIDSRRYQAEAGGAIRVTFPIYVVEVPRCGQSWDDLARPQNGESHNFGCATNANIAAMVANPTDMVTPRGSTPADASRRQVVLEKYRAGQPTSSAQDEQARGVISNAIK